MPGGIFCINLITKMIIDVQCHITSDICGSPCGASEKVGCLVLNSDTREMLLTPFLPPEGHTLPGNIARKFAYRDLFHSHGYMFPEDSSRRVRFPPCYGLYFHFVLPGNGIVGYRKK